MKLSEWVKKKTEENMKKLKGNKRNIKDKSKIGLINKVLNIRLQR